MDLKRFAKSTATRLPPIRSLVDSRAAIARHAAALEDQIGSLDAELDRARQGASQQASALDEARGAVARQEAALHEARSKLGALEAKLDAASELSFDVDAISAAAAGKGRYKSCAWIEEGVFFGDRQVNICCMQSVGNKTPKLFDLDGGPVDFASIETAKRRYRIANQTNLPPCGDCYLLQENDWEAKPQFTFLAIAGFLHCNLACSYCVTYNFDPKDRGGDVFGVIQQLHAQGALKRDVSRLEWGGGESTFHRDFAKVAEFAAEAGIQMTVYTNATAYVPALEAGLRSGLFNIVCSVDAGFRETYTRIKGRDLLDKVWANLDRYAALNPAAVKLKYIVMEANCGAAELDEFLRRAVSSKAGVVIVSPNAHNNAGSDFQVSEAVEAASVYLYAKAQAAGLYVGASEFYEPELRARIEAQAQALDGDASAPDILRHNRGGVMEIAFVDSEPFHRRFKAAVAEREDFRVVFPQPIMEGETPQGLADLLTGWRLGAGAALQGPLAPFAEGAGPGASPILGYDLNARFNGARLAALDFMPC